MKKLFYVLILMICSTTHSMDDDAEIEQSWAIMTQATNTMLSMVDQNEHLHALDPSEQYVAARVAYCALLQEINTIWNNPTERLQLERWIQRQPAKRKQQIQAHFAHMRTINNTALRQNNFARDSNAILAHLNKLLQPSWFSYLVKKEVWLFAGVCTIALGTWHLIKKHKKDKPHPLPLDETHTAIKTIQ